VPWLTCLIACRLACLPAAWLSVQAKADTLPFCAKFMCRCALADLLACLSSHLPAGLCLQAKADTLPFCAVNASLDCFSMEQGLREAAHR
jgi:hypothetical protein